MQVKVDIDRFMADWRTKFYGQHYPLKTGKIDKNILDLKKVLSPEDSLLDVGCNVGSVYKALGHKNYRGIDLDGEAIESARSRFPGVDFRFGDLFSIEGEWDVVLCSRVLMHVAPFKDAMEKLLGAAKKYLALFVPIAQEDVCEIHRHGQQELVDTYFRKFSEASLRRFGECSINKYEPYCTVIYKR